MSAHYLSDDERSTLDDEIRRAERLCRAEFSVFVGRAAGDTHDFATSLHNSLVAPTRSVVVMVDPDQRAVEVVTGGWVRRTLTDDAVGRVVETMTRCFAEGDLLEGLRRGIQQLAAQAKAPESLPAPE